MSLLEHRYRRVLRLLPAFYRAEREEEMAATFMEMSGDVPDDVNARPSWGEIASVVALSVRLRLGAVRDRPRSFAWGEAVRLAALLGLAYQAVYGVLVAADVLSALRIAATPFAGAPESFERLMALRDLGSALCAVVAFTAIMRARPRLAKVAALLGTAPLLAYQAIALVLPGPAGDGLWTEAGRMVVTAAPVIALLLGFHRDVTPPRRSWWLTLAPPATGLMMLAWAEVWLALRLYESEWLALWLDLDGTAIAALVVGSAFAMARGPAPSRALGLSIAGLLLLLSRLSLLIDLYGSATGDIATVVATQCVLLTVLAGALAAVGLRSLPGAGAATLT
ncbi:hypothetical protein ACIBI9_15670 [Nonomuraea sp. NPDC050451]|uniref:hypothetical protein n=1 Tax=Nonomuraea sp. NPDC050451 TaxID=3364364 RepID=UPI003794C6C9